MGEEINQREKSWYDRNYKILLFIPVAVFIAALVYIIIFYQTNGDLFKKDVSLTGGTSITVFNEQRDAKIIGDELKALFPDVHIRAISDIRTGKQHGFTLESQQKADALKAALEEKLGYKLTDENSSVEFAGSSLSSGFYQQLLNAITAAFILMGAVVFLIFGESRRSKLISVMISAVAISILFRNVNLLSYSAIFVFGASLFWYLLSREFRKSKYKRLEPALIFIGGILLIQKSLIGTLLPAIKNTSDYILVGPLLAILVFLYIRTSVPSIAVIFAAFADIVMTVAVIDLLEVNISAAGIVAFLMLIGYSVDTDILLTSRTLRNREGTVNQRIFGAFKTGITMTLAAIASVGVSLIIIYSFSETLKQIFGIILIGLVMDIMNTWMTNASILKWYMEAKGIQ